MPLRLRCLDPLLLLELDAEGKLMPRLATGWQWLDDRTLEVTLRQGVKFHNGEVFDAEIVKLNWDENIRLEQPFQAGYLLLAETAVTTQHWSVRQQKAAVRE